MDENNEDDAAYGLLVAFPDDSDSFVHGFEAGKIWSEMESGTSSMLRFTTHVENREVIRRMADNLGWGLQSSSAGTAGWDDIVLQKSRPARGRQNPHGLRLV